MYNFKSVKYELKGWGSKKYDFDWYDDGIYFSLVLYYKWKAKIYEFLFNNVLHKIHKKFLSLEHRPLFLIHWVWVNFAIHEDNKLMVYIKIIVSLLISAVFKSAFEEAFKL